MPPAPVPPERDLPVWRALAVMTRNPIAGWPRRVYEDRLVVRRLLGRTMVLVNEPALVRRVLADNERDFVRPVASKRMLRPGTGNGVLLAEGADWRRQRRILAPAFTPRHIASLVPHFVAGAGRLMARLDACAGGRVNLSAALQEAALDIAARSMFSLSLDDRAGPMAALLTRYQKKVGRFTLWDLLARRESDFGLFLRARADFHRQWFGEVDRLVALHGGDRTGSRPPDVLDLLQAARDPETGEALRAGEIRDQVATLLGAGFETTARALFWTCHLLALYPDIQERLAVEIATRLGGRAPDAAALEDLALLRATFFEALRLYPPAALVTRQTVRPVELDGHHVPVGAFVTAAPWAMHRHRAYWDDPLAFRPERFVGREREIVQSGWYMPFGSGPRVCLGAAFATSEALVVLARLIASHRIVLADDRPVVPVVMITTMPSIEPWFRLEPRADRPPGW
ncbi:MAG: cytochrome P450 [Alphaproteobacteria bacterium]|nr:cytochrome P450 [Alphaproteobacteria bacterium]